MEFQEVRKRGFDRFSGQLLATIEAPAPVAAVLSAVVPGVVLPGVPALFSALLLVGLLSIVPLNVALFGPVVSRRAPSITWVVMSLLLALLVVAASVVRCIGVAAWAAEGKGSSGAAGEDE